MPDLIGTRIAVLNNFPGPGMGGGEAQTLHVLTAALEAGMAAYLFCPPGAAIGIEARHRGVAVMEADMHPRRLLRRVGRLGRLIAEIQPHIVQGTGFLTNLLARSVAPEGARVVNLVQVEPAASLADGGSRVGLAFRRNLDARSRARVDAFVAVSRAVADALIEDGAPPDRVRVIHAAVDPDAVRAAASRPVPVALPEGRPLIGVVARLHPVKGVEHFVRAAALVARVRDDARFAVVGAGPQESRLREIAFAERIQDRVAFLGGLPVAAPVIAACDIVALPSLSEGLPVVALEGMALGKPVVGTRVGGIPEVLDEGAAGVLVPPADPDALATALLDLLSDASRREELAKIGPARVAEHFSVAAASAAYRELWTRLVGA